MSERGQIQFSRFYFISSRTLMRTSVGEQKKGKVSMVCHAKGTTVLLYDGAHCNSARPSSLWSALIAQEWRFSKRAPVWHLIACVTITYTLCRIYKPSFHFPSRFCFFFIQKYAQSIPFVTAKRIRQWKLHLLGLMQHQLILSSSGYDERDESFLK